MASVSIDGVQAQAQANVGERKPAQKRKALCIGVRYAQTAKRFGGSKPPTLPHAHEDLKVVKALLKGQQYNLCCRLQILTNT